MTFRCIIWAAVSTPQQAQDQKESIPAQVEQSRQVILQKGWQEVSEPLIVPGQSRNINWLDQAMREIPAMQELISLADARKIDLVIVRDWDRLARTESLRVQISTRLREQGVQVYSINQPVEPQENFQGQSDTALLVEGMSGILGEMENRLRVRRWRMGMLGRIKRGLWPNKETSPYGYHYNQETGILDVAPKEAEVVRLIFHLATEGLSTAKIAAELNLQGHPPCRSSAWVSSTVHAVLTKPTYLGLIPFDGNIYPGTHELIVEKALWESVQVTLAQRRHFGGRGASSPHVLSGLLRCGHCKGAMWANMTNHKRQKVYVYYQCCLYRGSGGSKCRRNSHREHEMVEVLLNYLRGLVDEEHFREEIEKAHLERRDQMEQEAVDLRKDLAQMDGRRSRQFKAYELGEIDLQEYAEHRLALAGEERRLKGRLEEIETSLHLATRMVNFREALNEVLIRWTELPPPSLRSQLATFIDTIEIYEDGQMVVKFLG